MTRRRIVIDNKTAWDFWPCWFDNRSKNNERVDHCHIVSTSCVALLVFLLLLSWATQEIQNCHLGAGSRKTTAPPTCREKVLRQFSRNQQKLINIVADDMMIMLLTMIVFSWSLITSYMIWIITLITRAIKLSLGCSCCVKCQQRIGGGYSHWFKILLLLLFIIIIMVWRKAPMSQ